VVNTRESCLGLPPRPQASDQALTAHPEARAARLSRPMRRARGPPDRSLAEAVVAWTKNTGLARSPPARVNTKDPSETSLETERLMVLHHDTALQRRFKGSLKVASDYAVILAVSSVRRMRRTDHERA
jgi:hypothetical protein